LVEIMKLLVDAKADIGARDEVGNTALMNAAYMGQLAATVWLLEHGAEINAKSSKGDTALSYAKARGHTEVVALLTAKGAQ
jgi:ankyrin repeat protein